MRKTLINFTKSKAGSVRAYRFIQLDVFTEVVFGGNPLAVFPEAEGLTDTEMQAIAREMNLSETVFVIESNYAEALRRLRIFTPMNEVPLAGHPVVGTWNCLARQEYGGLVAIPEGGTGRTSILHELGIGVLPVEIEFTNCQPTRVVMTQGEFKITQTIDDEQFKTEIIAALGLQPDDANESLPVCVVSTGLQFLVVPLRSLDALGRCQVQSTNLIRLYRSVGAIGCSVFTCEVKDVSSSAAHTRMFAPDDGILEDPATGSAAGALGAYLVHHYAISESKFKNSDGAFKFTIEQGDFMNRASRIEVEVRQEANRIGAVRVGGSAVVVAEGKLMF